MNNGSIDIGTANRDLDNKAAVDILHWVYDNFPAERVKLSTSFGAEGMALLHMLVTLVKQPRIFTVDTGRNFQETYDVWDEAVQRYSVSIETYYPEPQDIAELMQGGEGPNLFYRSVENRKRCCHVRKVKPLDAALQDAEVWLTGLRRHQGVTRREIPLITYNERYRVLKVCPLANWFEENVWEYIRTNDVPYNKLHDRGYPTVGCMPCTRPCRPAEDPRSGRWWWEKDEKKECGIHIEDGKVVRTKPPSNYSI